MKWKKLGVRKKPRDNIFQPGLNNVRNSLSLIRRKSTDSDEIGTSGTDLPSTSNSLNIAQTSMESLCRIDDEGLDGKDESSYSSIEQTRDTSFKSPMLFGLDDSTSAIARHFVRVRPIKRRLAIYRTSEAGSSQIKNSTMNQSAIEADTVAIDNVSPIDNHKGKGKRGRSTTWSFPDEGQTFQEDSSIEAVKRNKIPAHINAFMKKFENVNEQQHDESPCEPIDDEDSGEWSPAKLQDKMPLREWLSPERMSKKKLRTFSHKDRRSPFEKCAGGVATLPGESVRTSSPTTSLVETTLSKNINLHLQVSSIYECREDSEVPLGREGMKKSTVNSEEIVADSGDLPIDDSLKAKGHSRVDEADYAEPPVYDNLAVSLDFENCPQQETSESPNTDDDRADEVKTAEPGVHENLNVSLDVEKSRRKSLNSIDTGIDAAKPAQPDVHENPTHSMDVENQADEGTTESPDAFSSVPLDEIGLATLNSARTVRVHHCTPVKSTDSIHSVPLDEFGANLDMVLLSKRRK